jgi:hypothetical protein
MEMVAMRKRIKVRTEETLIKETTEMINEMRGDPKESQRSLMQDLSKKVCSIILRKALCVYRCFFICFFFFKLCTILNLIGHISICNLTYIIFQSSLHSYVHFSHMQLSSPFHITFFNLRIALRLSYCRRRWCTRRPSRSER